MEAADAITLVQLMASALILGYGSFTDWKTRRAKNELWLALSAVGIVLLPLQVMDRKLPPGAMLILVPILAILSDIYLDSEGEGLWKRAAPYTKYGIAVASIAILALVWPRDMDSAHLLAIPVMMLVIVLMYMVDVVRGGADAKALIALSIIFPYYPVIGSFPLLSPENWQAQIMFPFSFVVLINAAIIVALLPIAFAVKNISAHEFDYPFGFLGYKMDADTARSKFVWLMERIEDGKLVRYTRPKRNEDLESELDRLSKAGHKRVWITPKIPFIIPISISLIFSVIVGNLLLLIVPL